MFTKITHYFAEVWLELRKATWPWDPKLKGFAKYKELIDSTLVVFVGMLLMGGFVATFDTVFRYAFEWFIQSGGVS
jgi:preprotein translocase subunit SecE